MRVAFSRLLASLFPTSVAMLAMAVTASAQTEAATTTTYYQLTTGTGFVINGSGNVITNAHVVKACKSISILTPLGEEPAELGGVDTKQDLAVLKTGYLSKNIAPLRWNIDNLHVGDTVAVMGFPGEEGANGHAQFKKTRVTALRGPVGEERWIQLASVAARGNSGGPVLDAAGNVIAVISGMAMTYRVDSGGHLSGNAIGKADVAITLAALRNFLYQNNVAFSQAPSGLVAYDDAALRDHASEFIVPVRCVVDTVTR